MVLTSSAACPRRARRAPQDEELEKACEACGRASARFALRRRLQHLPRVLVLHLQRFGVHGTVIKKRQDPVACPPMMDLGALQSRCARPPVAMKADAARGSLPARSACVRRWDEAAHRGPPLADVSNLWHHITPAQSTSGRPPAGPGSGDVGGSPMAADCNSGDDGDEDMELAIALSVEEDHVTACNACRLVLCRDRKLCGRSAQRGAQRQGPMMDDNSMRECKLVQQRRGAVQHTPLKEDDSSGDEPAHKDQVAAPRCRYHLHAIVSHLGSQPSIGHFVVDVYDAEYNQWMHHNDSMVQVVPASSIFSQQKGSEGYLYFYIHEDFANISKAPMLRPSSKLVNNGKAHGQEYGQKERCDCVVPVEEVEEERPNGSINIEDEVAGLVTGGIIDGTTKPGTNGQQACQDRRREKEFTSIDVDASV
eukprot:SM000062S19911  [mRNA]  locus=s62:370488:374137:+ [translate_table: standard]